MHETSPLWKQILSEPDHRKEIKVKINGTEYGLERIIRVSVAGRLFDAPGVGNAFSRTLELGVMPYGKISPLSEIRLFVRLVSADGQRVSEYIPKGVFYADTVTCDSVTGAAKISGYDAIMKMELPFGASGELNRACDIIFKDGIGGTWKFTRRVGDAVPMPVIPERTGYVLAAWSPPLPETVTGDATYTAQWTPTLQIYVDRRNVLVVKGADASVSGSRLSIISDDVSVSDNILHSDTPALT